MKKLERFLELKSSPNSAEFLREDYLQRSKIDFLKNLKNPIALELACGKGEYTVALAKAYPNRLVVGVDLKGNRLWVPAKYCLENDLRRAFFLRTDVKFLDAIFPKESVSEIWIPFPDPYLKKSKSNKRLTSKIFLQVYKKFLLPNGRIYLKTDSYDLYQFTLETLSQMGAVIISNKQLNIDYCSEDCDFPLNVKTYYEKLNVSKSDKIYFLSFCLSK